MSLSSTTSSTAPSMSSMSEVLTHPGLKSLIDGTLAFITFLQLTRFHRRDKRVGWTRQKVLHLMIGSSNTGSLVYFVAAIIATCTRWHHWFNALGFLLMGLAVMALMLVTTCLMSLVIVLGWHKPPILSLAFLLFFGWIELLYFSASLSKFREGAWLPILLSLFFMIIMFVWHYTTTKKYEFDLHNKVLL